MDPKPLLSVTGVVVLASFVPLTAISFLKYRLPRKAEEYDKILTALGFRDDEGPAYLPNVDNEYRAFDYVLPVAFATLVAALGAMTLILGPRLAGIEDVSLILDGPAIAASHSEQPHLTKLFGMLVIGLAFAGSYIWSIQNLFRRLSTLDLQPSAYYSVGVRIVFSIFVSLMIYYLFLESNGAQQTRVRAPAFLSVLVFLAGMFPQRGLQYIQEWVRFEPRAQGKQADPTPLAMIEGLQLFERVRLSEIGIDNAQNLAKSNFIEVLLRTPFSPREIIDWIGQARLYLFFTQEIVQLRRAGVRTVFDLKKTAGSKQGLEMLSEESGVPLPKLQIVYEIIKDDPDIQSLEDSLCELLGFGRGQDGGRTPRGDGRSSHAVSVSN